jgi:hypothetical protein
MTLSNLKIGVVLTGHSYTLEKGYSAHTIDWRLAKDNILLNLINPLKKDNQVKTYLTTYNNLLISHLIEFYQPQKTLVVAEKDSHYRGTYMASIQNLVNEDLDYIISTGFDIQFTDIVTTYNISPDKFNFIFRESEPFWSTFKLTGDRFFAFPMKYINAFIESIKFEYDNRISVYATDHLNNVYTHISRKIGEKKCNFIFEGNHSSAENSHYKTIKEKAEELSSITSTLYT